MAVAALGFRRDVASRVVCEVARPGEAVEMDGGAAGVGARGSLHQEEGAEGRWAWGEVVAHGRVQKWAVESGLAMRGV